jgi:hypothetical protein
VIKKLVIATVAATLAMLGKSLSPELARYMRIRRM